MVPSSRFKVLVWKILTVLFWKFIWMQPLSSLNLPIWLFQLFLELSRLILVSLKKVLLWVAWHAFSFMKIRPDAFYIATELWGFFFSKSEFVVSIFHQHVSCVLEIVALFNGSILGKYFSGWRTGEKKSYCIYWKLQADCILKGALHSFFFPLKKDLSKLSHESSTKELKYYFSFMS